MSALLNAASHPTPIAPEPALSPEVLDEDEPEVPSALADGAAALVPLPEAAGAFARVSEFIAGEEAIGAAASEASGVTIEPTVATGAGASEPGATDAAADRVAAARVLDGRPRLPPRCCRGSISAWIWGLVGAARVAVKVLSRGSR